MTAHRRYNDPSYVKLEKLEIMVKLASAHNIDQVRAWNSSRHTGVQGHSTMVSTDTHIANGI